MPASRSRRAVLALLGTTLSAAAAGATPTTTDGSSTAGSSTSSTTAPATTEPTTTASASAFPTAVGDHPMFGVGPARTGHDPDERGPSAPIEPRWCVGSGVANRLTPIAVADGTVLVGSPATGLRALDPSTGKARWTAGFDGYPDAPTVAGDRVITTDGVAVYALGVGSGRELWSTTVGEQLTTSALVTDAGGDRTVLVAGEREDESGAPTASFVASVDAADGSVRWRTPVERNTLYGSLAARDGVVFGGGSGPSFHAFDVETGERRWRADVGDHATSPAVGSESVFVGDEPGVVHAFDPADGAERWIYEAGSEIRSSPAVADGTVYVAATDGILHAIDARTGERRWRFDGGRSLTVSPTVVGRGDDAVVHVGSAQGNVFAVNAADGSLRWSHQLPDAAETAPVVVDGIVFVGDDEGRVHALVDASMSRPDDARTCRIAEPTVEPDEPDGDSDGDGVPDADDYAPRDASVRRRADLETGSDDDGLGFLPGVVVGAVVSAFGAGVGWCLGTRGDRGTE